MANQKIKPTQTQQEIIDSDSKRILVLSCAGSGKTFVVVSRIERLIASGVKPESILALTFSNRAAHDMMNRIKTGANKKALEAVEVKTFHAFGFEFLKDYSRQLGFEKRVSIADQTEIDGFLKDALKKANMPAQSSGILASYIRSRKTFNETIPDDAAMDGLAEAYSKSLRLKSKVDLDDLIYLPIVSFESNPELKEALREKHKYIFVDEYQDTNEAQNRFLDAITGPDTSLCLVGDDDQAIYEWRGARPEYIRKKASSGDFDCFYLTENFRSQKRICDVANRVIARNKIRVPKAIQATKDSFLLPTYHFCSTQEKEALYVASEIKKLLNSGRFLPSDIAVLYRNNNQQELVKKALSNLDIKSESLDVDENFKYSRLIKVLKAIVDLNSFADLAAGLNFPTRFFDNIAFEEAKKAYESEQETNLPSDPMKAVEQLYNSEVLFPDSDLFRHRFAIIRQLHYAKTWSTTELLSYLISDFVAQGYDEKCPEEYEYLQQTFAMARSYEDSYGPKDLANYINDFLMAVNNNDENFKSSSDAVALLTMHRSKGLEFGAVFIIGLQVGIFPNDYFVRCEEDLEAERRLFYVAVTRAKDILYLTSFQDPLGAPTSSVFVKCGFLAEVPSVFYSKEEMPLQQMSALPVKVQRVDKDTPDVYSAKVAEKNSEPVEEKGLFALENIALSDDQIGKYQDECLALSQQIKIPSDKIVVVIGAVDMKTDIMYSILKANGFKKDQIEYYDYKDSKLNYRRYCNNSHCVGIILGPNAHNQVGGFDLVSILSQDGFPFLVNLVNRHISKSSLQTALIKIKLNLQRSES